VTAGPVTVRLTQDAAAFAAAAGGWLDRDPVRTSIVASALAAAVAGALAERVGPGPRWVLVRRGEEVVGAGMLGHPAVPVLHLPPMPDDAAAAVAESLADGARVPMDAVIGDAGSTLAFTQAWTRRTGEVARRTMARGYHVLDRLVPPANGVPGTTRVATPADAALVTGWSTAFHTEIWRGVPPPPADPGQLHDRLAGGRLLIREEAGRPVAMAGWHPPAGAPGRAVVRVGTVWTVPDHRRRGHGTAVTAAATRGAAATGAAVVMLHTDLANPTSNGVYARLGYRLVGEGSAWRFAATATADATATTDDAGLSRSGTTSAGC